MIKKFLFILIAVATSTSFVMAQSKGEKKETKEEKEVEISKNNKAEKFVVEIDGDNITVNGVPIEKFGVDNLEVTKGKKLGSMMFGENFLQGFRSLNDLYSDKIKPNKAILGVSSLFNKTGAVVSHVSKGSAAEKAGLLKEDIITKIDDETITDTNTLYKIIGKYKPDTKITITYIRNGKTQTTTAVLDKYKGPKEISLNNNVWGYEVPNTDNFINSYPRRPKIGLEIQDVEVGNGVKVLDVDDDSPAEKAGLKDDDIITEIDGAVLKNVDEFKEKLRNIKEGDYLKIKYKRGNKAYQTEIKLPKRLKKASL
jgi:serine protease Do